MTVDGSLRDEAIIDVQLAERSYPIHIGSGVLANLTRLLQTHLPKCRHAVMVYDRNVAVIAEQVGAELTAAGIRVTELDVASGETSKSIAVVQSLWERMLEEHTDRGSAVMAIGGGVIGDLAGFAAATFARGLPLVQLPTTLLSQVDSSVGGKTGINLPGAKNMVGAFWQPSCVLIDLQTLESLPQREFVSGLAEVVKYGMIELPELFEFLEQHADDVLSKDNAALRHIIAASCRAKAAVVAEDERETSGRRAILNYGHTFAHALESATGYGSLLHGEAVAIGMHLAARLAWKLGRIPLDLVERQRQLLDDLKLPTRFAGVDPLVIWELMQHDKKVEHGRLRFVLPSRLGHVELVPDVSQDQVLATIEGH